MKGEKVMKKFKKIISMVLTLVLAISCMSFSVNAADNPDYLNNREEYLSLLNMRLNYVPPASSVVFLPGNSGSFNYSFGVLSEQYSDFVIAPRDYVTGIRMFYEATSDTHTVMMKVKRLDNSQVVYSSNITVLAGLEQELYLDYPYFEKNMGYYIELTNPSISGASGTFTITD